MKMIYKKIYAPLYYIWKLSVLQNDITKLLFRVLKYYYTGEA